MLPGGLTFLLQLRCFLFQSPRTQIPAKEILIWPIHLFPSRPCHGFLTSVCIDTIGSETSVWSLEEGGVT